MRKIAGIATMLTLASISSSAFAAPIDADLTALLTRLDKLEADNARLTSEIDLLRRQAPQPTAEASIAAAPTQIAAAASQQASAPARQVIGTDAVYSAAALGHTENVNQRRLVQLQTRASGGLKDVITLSGEVIAIGDAHWSNRPNKFGYLMRHPTGSNQRTKAAQEITINSVQLGMTFTPTHDITGYFEMLYDPEQSFGAGTLTALARNQLQIRKAYVMWGDLNRSPLYAAVGKMDVPFGLQDSVSPFTNSTNWHAFAPLAFGGEVGYYHNGLSLRAMAVGGGAQFRGTNTPVDGTAIPSKLNNFALDASYKLKFADDDALMLGGSYLHGSGYCQPYPIVHFGACSKAVPAWSAYGRLSLGQLEVIGEYASTTKVWPGTHVPDPLNSLSVFAASKVSAFTFGGRYKLGNDSSNTKLSLEYSKFLAGAPNSPWHRQDQWVLGLAHQFVPGVSVFSELIKTDGYAPLNFISGGNFADGSSWSDASARSQVLMTGIRAGF
jgi:hypothetical protein